MRNIAFYLGHDASCIINDPMSKKAEYYPLDKFFNVKHFLPTPKSWLTNHIPGPGVQLHSAENHGIVFEGFYDFLEHIGILDEIFDNLYLKRYQNVTVKRNYFKSYPHVNILSSLIRAKNKHIIKDRNPSHHYCHGLYGYHESPFKKSLILTYDGGGDWESCNVFGVNDYVCEYSKVIPNNIVTSYSQIGRDMEIISPKTSMPDYAGKVMGLSAYGKYSDNFLELYDYYRESNFYTGRKENQEEWDQHTSNISTFKQWRKSLQNLSDADMAWASQKLFQVVMHKTFEKELVPYLEEYENNVVLSGGGALNVLFNEEIKTKYPHVNFFVPPDPSDGALSIGFLANYEKNNMPKIGNHSSLRLLDEEKLDYYIKYYAAKPIDAKTLAIEYFNRGKIIGYLSGTIEVGPRALCHRSILCNPKYPNMKDTLNKKVKHREWYRPFAPVCREEKAKKYFNSIKWDNMETMAYAVTVKKQHQENLKAITHEDGTARLQLLKRIDEPFIYHALKFVDGEVLLNTSFNEGGRPILNKIETALKMLEDTELDHVVIFDEKRDVHWIFRDHHGRI